MAYINKNDTISVIETATLDSISNSSQLSTAIAQAESETFGYLRTFYDVAEIQKQQGANRHAMLILVIVDIALYHLHARVSPAEIPDIRVNRYNEAKRWLENVASGLIKVDMPTLSITSKGKIRSGSNESFKPYY